MAADTIPMAFAGIGVIASIVYFVLILKGIRSLQDIRDILAEQS